MGTGISAVNNVMMRPATGGVVSNVSSNGARPAKATHLNSAKGRKVEQHASKLITYPLIATAVITLGIPATFGALNMFRSDGNAPHWPTNGKQAKDGFLGTYEVYGNIVEGAGGFLGGLAPNASHEFFGTGGTTYTASGGQSAATRWTAQKQEPIKAIDPQVTIELAETASDSLNKLLDVYTEMKPGVNLAPHRGGMEQALVNAVFAKGPISLGNISTKGGGTMGFGGDVSEAHLRNNITAKLREHGYEPTPEFLNQVVASSLNGRSLTANLTEVGLKVPSNAFASPQQAIAFFDSGAFPLSGKLEIATPSALLGGSAPAQQQAVQRPQQQQAAQAPQTQAAQPATNNGVITVSVKATGGGLASLDKCMPGKEFKGGNRASAGPTLINMNPGVDFGNLVKNRSYDLKLPAGWRSRLSLTNNPNCKAK